MRDKIFISYCHEDQKFVNEFIKHLKSWKDDGTIKLWSDKDIETGKQWQKSINEAIESTAVVVFFISPDFLASDFIRKHEIPPLVATKYENKLAIANLFIRASTVKDVPFEISGSINGKKKVILTEFQGLNDPDKPLKDLRTSVRDKVLSDAAIKVRDLYKKFAINVKSHNHLQTTTDHSEISFEGYLDSILNSYKDWWHLYTFIYVMENNGTQNNGGIERKNRSSHLLDLGSLADCSNESYVTPIKIQQNKPLDVLEAMRIFANNHVLLVGQGGCGKSTVLKRLLIEEAKRCKTSETVRIPVLVKLRHYRTSIMDLLLNEFKKHGLFLYSKDIETLLFEKRLLLLLDGLNELPSSDAYRELCVFRSIHLKMPIIVTTRALPGDLSIEKKLEIQPLTQTQIQSFLHNYLPELHQQLFSDLEDATINLAEIPLLLWMLCSCYQEQKKIPAQQGFCFVRLQKAMKTN